MKFSPWLSVPVVLAGILSSTPTSRALDFRATYQGQDHTVVRVRGSTPYVLVGGKLVAADPATIMLQPGMGGMLEGELPPWVYTSPIKAKRRSLSIYDAPKDMNFELSGEFEVESTQALENVYAVFTLFTERAGSGNLMVEVGSLRPFSSKKVTLRQNLSGDIGDTRFVVHLFANGRPLYSSGSDEGEFAGMFLVRASRDRSPSGEGAPAPFYTFPPRKLSRSATTATVKFRIEATGRVLDAQIVGATDAKTAEAVLDAARRWWFRPAWHGGRPVPAEATFTLDLTRQKTWSNEAVQPVASGQPAPQPDVTAR